MKAPRAHHYVPQFYLGGFTDPLSTKPSLWVYERSKPIRRSTPRESGHWHDYYVIESKDGSKNFELEHILSQLEGIVAPLLQQSNPAAILERKAVFAVFVAFSQQRVPAARELTRELARQMFSAVKDKTSRGTLFRQFLEKVSLPQEIGPFDEEFFEWIRSTDERQLELSKAQVLALTIGSAFDLAQDLFEAGWELWKSPNQMFVTSDNPAYTVKSGERVNFGWGFKVQGVEMLFPLRRDLLLRISRKVLSDRVFEIPPAVARDANKMTMCCTTRFLFGAERSEKIRKLFDVLPCQVRFEKVSMAPSQEFL
jgi:hypothetical protein